VVASRRIVVQLPTPPPVKPPVRQSPSPRVRLAAAFLALAFLAFGPALRAPLDFDDFDAITENASIRQIWPPGVALHPPPLGTPVSGRPVVNYSFALNYAVNRWLGVAQAPVTAAPQESIGYHVVNVLIHVVAALLLAGVIRRTIRFGRVPEGWRDASDRIAVIAAGIWLLHPIQTEAVDYVSQRTELLVSACYLATLYAAIRAWQAGRATGHDSLSTSRHVIGWSIAAVVFSLLGMGSKEVMITAPLMVMLYDRAFLAPDWRTLLDTTARRRLYGGLFATSALSLALIASGARGSTVGQDGGIAWYQYLYSQAWAIPHYVRLLFWPDGLTFDYGRSPIHGLAGVPGAIGLMAAGAATLVAWRRLQWQWLGFLGAWFFLLLGPSSSFVPIRTEIAAERRVYLACAAIILLFVIALERLIRRRALRTAVITAIGLLMISATFRRSAMYSDLRVRWLDGIARTPTNGRAYQNLASAELRADPPRAAQADSALRRAMAVDSSYIPAWVLSAKIAAAQNRLVDAVSLLEHALRLHPGDAAATEELGKVLLAQNRPDLALPFIRQFAEFHTDGESLTSLGRAYLMTRQLDSAISALRRAAELDSTQVDARRYLGAALVERDRGAEALAYLQQAVRLDSTSGIIFGLLSLAYAQSGQADAAARAAGAAVTKAPDNPTVYVFAGRALHAIGRYADAADTLEHALRLSAEDPQALTRLGMALAAMGHPREAARLYERAIALVPGYPLAQQGLQQLRSGRAVR
jgi:protein O-mannosyl-transferase